MRQTSLITALQQLSTNKQASQSTSTMMKQNIRFFALIAIFFLAITIAQAYESSYDSNRHENRREFLHGLLDSLDQQKDFELG